MKEIPVVYLDQDILIVNKPYGLAVQGGAGISICLIDVLESQMGEKIYPVHRLDRDTSGLMILCRSSRSAAMYTNILGQGETSKRYQAVCFGKPPRPSDRIIMPAGKAGKRKSADTLYTLLGSTSDISLLDLELGTGRMHQIRLHLASIGCPIIADDKYGDFPKNRSVRSEYGIRKLQLAAYSLTVPIGGIARQFSIPLPQHMSSCLDSFGLSALTE
ncbi:MAG: RluA family pseudouridine synthase [Spirochaetales bacterium]|nr:RluA family pseudouridine synthase [Spirochaetales bacterium]